MHAMTRPLGRQRKTPNELIRRHRLARGLGFCLLGLVLLGPLCLLPGGCVGKPKDIAVEMPGWRMTMPQVVAEYERINGAGSFASTTAKVREDFVRTLADKELLLRLARKTGPKLDARQSHIYRVNWDEWIVRDYLSQRRDAHKPSPEEVAAIHRKLGRETSVLGTLFKTKDVAEQALAEIKSGASFDDVSRRLGVPNSTPKPSPGMDVPTSTTTILKLMKLRVDGRGVYPPFILETAMKDLPEGALTKPIPVTEGAVILKVVGYRDLPEAQDPAFFSGKMGDMITGMVFASVQQKWLDSLKTTTGTLVHPETFPVVRKRMVAFWDSLDVLRTQGVVVDYPNLPAPTVHSLPPAEASQILFELRGKKYTVEEYFRGLNDTDMNNWPFGDSLKMATRIQERVNRLLIQSEAVKIGFDKTPGFVQRMKRLEEQGLLNQYHDGFMHGVEPTPGEIKALFDQLPPGGGLLTGERLSFSALVYPMPLKDRAQATLVKLRAGGAASWEALAKAEQQADPAISYVPPTRLLEYGRPMPVPSWNALIAEAQTLQPDQISDVLPGQNSWDIVRLIKRLPAGAMTLEESTPRLRQRVIEAKQDSVTEATLVAARSKIAVKIHTELLAAGAAPDTTQGKASAPAPGRP
jgi:hypothetical protein